MSDVQGIHDGEGVAILIPRALSWFQSGAFLLLSWVLMTSTLFILILLICNADCGSTIGVAVYTRSADSDLTPN